MIFDDDDELYTAGLKAILTDCARQLPDNVAGFIYHLDDQDRRRIGDPFPVPRSNFLELRADYGIKGDKKEVVLASALKDVIYHNRLFRRSPTSIMWSRIAIKFDVLCRNVVIGRKFYLPGGMSKNIRRLKRENSLPMAVLYASQLFGFFQGRYRSPGFLIKAAGGFIYYGSLSIASVVRDHRAKLC